MLIRAVYNHSTCVLWQKQNTNYIGFQLREHNTKKFITKPLTWEGHMPREIIHPLSFLKGSHLKLLFWTCIYLIRAGEIGWIMLRTIRVYILHPLVLSSLQLHLGGTILGIPGIRDMVVPPKLHLCHITHIHLSINQQLIVPSRHQCTPEFSRQISVNTRFMSVQWLSHELVSATDRICH